MKSGIEGVTGSVTKRRKKYCGTHRRKLLLPVLFLLVVLAAGAFSAERTYAQTSITLNPGQTYDLASAGKNTSVYINKKGTYTLKGKTRYVRVVITCGGVDCYLDGVDLNNNEYSNTGRRSSPMNICDDGGTIRLISKKGTKNYFEGYMNPGICKNGTSTNLVFETEDPGNPGTIEAKGGLDSAGIGCVMHVSATPEWSEPTGNITINSGNVIGKGGRQSAGIGGSFSSSLNGLTINGGDVKAYGNGDGAAIGAGYHGRAENIHITGGTVYAENAGGRSGSAAIGGGGGYDYEGASAYGKNITISGGKVTAVSGCDGAAIGGGVNSAGKNITISGGTVDAKCKGFHTLATPAIGGGGGRFPGNASVKITGGYVKAKGGEDAPAIGSGGGEPGYTVNVDVHISGGVVIAEKGNKHSSSMAHNYKDIGSGFDHKDNVNVRITGGSVYAGNVENAKNDNGDKLHRVDVTCCMIPKSGQSFYLGDMVFSNDYSYGTNDVMLINVNKDQQTGMFYPWLPDTDAGASHAMLTTVYPNGRSEGGVYYGNFKCKDKSGDFEPGAAIKILPPATPPPYDDKVGSAHVGQGQTRLMIIKMPEIPEGRVITGYQDSTTGSDVADEKGNLLPNAYTMALIDPTDPDQGWEQVELTDENGKWVSKLTNETLSVVLLPNTYNIRFDANVPANSSSRVKGYTSGMTLAFDAEMPVNLSDNGYTLLGYVFKGWNTKADGSGKSYSVDPDNPSAPIKLDEHLSQTPWEDATLYAQWEPRKYDLKFDTGRSDLGGSFTMSDLVYDQEYVVPDVPADWEDENNSFACWRNMETGKLYHPGDPLVNQVAYLSDGTIGILNNGKLKTYLIHGVWTRTGTIAATVTKDGLPDPGHENEFQLFSPADPNTVYTPAFAYEQDHGIYTFKPSTDVNDENYLPEGQYILSLNVETAQGFMPEPAEIEYKLGKTAAVSFDYYTVSIEKDPAVHEESDGSIWSSSISTGGFAAPVTEIIAPDGTELSLQTNFTENCGYHFDGYTAGGVIPGRGGGGTGLMDFSKPSTKITVRGTASIMAHAQPNVYTIHFDSNSDKKVKGKMESQDMVYDQPQKLFANRFELIGGNFIGWNEAADGGGTWYEDGQTVENLTAKDGGEITLYAQWDIPEYSIEYDLDGGALPKGKQNPQTYVGTDSYKLVNPVKQDYIFLGWVGTDCHVPNTEVTIPAGSSGNRFYNACWTIRRYTVTFVTNGGSEVDQQSVAIHQKAVKPENPVREGYVFGGWYSDKGLTRAFDFNQEITSNRTVYAKWNRPANAVTVTFVTNGGSKVPAQTVMKGKTAKKPANPTRSGYSFKGWYADKALKKAFDFSKPITKNTTIYAKWAKKSIGPSPKPVPEKTVPVLMAKGAPSGKKAVKATWTEVPGASKYLVYAGRCGKRLNRVAVTAKTSFKVKKIKGSKLHRHTPYLFAVAAVDKNGKVIVTSKKFHVICGKTMGKYANIKTITANKQAVTLKKGQTVTVGAKVTLPKKKKHISRKHGPYLRYTTNCPKVASVSKKGKVTAKKAGTAKIYIQDTNGMWCVTTVTVK